MIHCTVSMARFRGGGARLNGSNWFNVDAAPRYLFSCTMPSPTGAIDDTTNITNAPDFTTDLHLQPSSPCLGAGTNLPWMSAATDLDGNPRIVDGRVDVGCYAYVPEPAALLLLAGLAGLLRRARIPL